MEGSFAARMETYDAQVAALLAEGRVEEALAVLDADLIEPPRALPGTVTVGTRLLLAGEWEKTIAYLDGVLEGRRGFDWAYYARALARRRLGDEVAAQQDLQRAIALAEERRQRLPISPTGPLSWLYAKYAALIHYSYLLDLPLYYLALGRPAEAEALYDAALSAAEQVLVHRAAQRLEELLAICPDLAPARTQLARLQPPGQAH